MSASSDEDSCLTPTPKESREQVSNTEFRFLPEKSREKYFKAYELFNNWRLSKGVETYSETVLLSYFMELSKTRQPGTLWSIYSMVKAVLKTKHDVNIETYPELVAFLKRKSEGHKPKKSKTFTAPEIEKFLNKAPDFNFLGIKVGLIIGINGACRSNELLNLTVNDIEKHSDKLILVKALNTKTKIDRSFVIREEYVNIIDKYMALRPAHTKTTRFFLQYDNGKCKVHPMGINKIGEIPRKIATFLKLPDLHLYTGHCLRRTSATLLADSGDLADLIVLKRHGRWEPSTVAEVYIEDSIESKSEDYIEIKSEDSNERKSKICKSIIESINSQTPTDRSRPSTSKENIIESRLVSPGPSACPVQCTNVETEILPNMQVNNTTITVPIKGVTFNLQNCSNLTFNF